MRNLILTLLFCICLVPVSAWSFPAKILRALDGDTYQVLQLPDDHAAEPHGQILRIRLYGIDSPESAQTYGAEASSQAHCFENVLVDIEPTNIDKYGRTVALVRLNDGSTIQEHLLRNGAAWVYPQFCKKSECKKWRKIESQARKNKVGLWDSASPTPPWRWRHMQNGKR